MLASRAARLRPAGPVPPKIPMRMTREPVTFAVPLAQGRLPSPDMGLLDGKKIVITGVMTDASLAFGVLSAVSGNQITILNPEIVAVSYPGFWQDLRRVVS